MRFRSVFATVATVGLLALCHAPSALAAGRNGGPTLTPSQALKILGHRPNVSGWLRRYPLRDLRASATYRGGLWTVTVYYNKRLEVAVGAIVDRSRKVLVAWVGPQVEWPMARGSAGSFGGKYLNSIPVFLGFAVAFLIGLAD